MKTKPVIGYKVLVLMVFSLSLACDSPLSQNDDSSPPSYEDYLQAKKDKKAGDGKKSTSDIEKNIKNADVRSKTKQNSPPTDPKSLETLENDELQQNDPTEPVQIVADPEKMEDDIESIEVVNEDENQLDIEAPVAKTAPFAFDPQDLIGEIKENPIDKSILGWRINGKAETFNEAKLIEVPELMNRRFDFNINVQGKAIKYGSNIPGYSYYISELDPECTNGKRSWIDKKYGQTVEIDYFHTSGYITLCFKVLNNPQETPFESETVYSYTFYRDNQRPDFSLTGLSERYITTKNVILELNAEEVLKEFRYSLSEGKDCKTTDADPIKEGHHKIGIVFKKAGLHYLCVRAYDLVGNYKENKFPVIYDDGKFQEVLLTNEDNRQVNQILISRRWGEIQKLNSFKDYKIHFSNTDTVQFSVVKASEQKTCDHPSLEWSGFYEPTQRNALLSDLLTGVSVLENDAWQVCLKSIKKYDSETKAVYGGFKAIVYTNDSVYIKHYIKCPHPCSLQDYTSQSIYVPSKDQEEFAKVSNYPWYEPNPRNAFNLFQIHGYSEKKDVKCVLPAEKQNACRNFGDSIYGTTFDKRDSKKICGWAVDVYCNIYTANTISNIR